MRTILVLALAPAVGLGIGRFAYSLVLPDMRDALGWSYATAGFMNTINAAGYLAGALGAAAFVRRYGLYAAVWVGTVACLISLALCAVTGNVVVFSSARLLAGFGAAIAFVGGGALAAGIAQSRPAQGALLLSLFYMGPAIGIVISGIAGPFLLDGFGPGSWWIVWAALTVISALLTLPVILTRIDAADPKETTAPAAIRLRPITLYLIGYFLFGAGYIAYMTFMIAYIRDAGGSAVRKARSGA